ncbi:MAG: sigma-70 family RNA polymerase sigma factor [Gemmatimonadaceae bacterium]
MSEAVTPKRDHRDASRAFDEATILDAMRKGDSAAFAELFGLFNLPLRRSAFRIVRSREVAAELVQDVFLRVWHRREELNVRGDLAAYLFTATRNRALDWNDRETRHRRWMERAAFDAAAAESEAEPQSVLELEQQRESLLSVIADVLNMLPPKRREICELRWLVGVGPQGIADRLGLSIKTVEVQITRGRARLRAQLQRSAQSST